MGKASWEGQHWVGGARVLKGLNVLVCSRVGTCREWHGNAGYCDYFGASASLLVIMDTVASESMVWVGDTHEPSLTKC